MPFSPVVPILSALACLYLMANLSVETWLRFLAWLVIGLVVYAAYGYRHSRLRARSEVAAAPRTEPFPLGGRPLLHGAPGRPGLP